MDISTKYMVAGNDLHSMNFLSLTMTWPAPLQNASLPVPATNSEPLTQKHSRRTHQLLDSGLSLLSSSVMERVVFSINKNNNIYSGFRFATFIGSTYLACINTIIHRLTIYLLSHYVITFNIVCSQQFLLIELAQPIEFSS